MNSSIVATFRATRQCSIVQGKTLTFLKKIATIIMIPMAVKKATSQRRTNTTLIDLQQTWLPYYTACNRPQFISWRHFFFGREMRSGANGWGWGGGWSLFPRPHVPPNGVMDFSTPDLARGIHIWGVFWNGRNQTLTAIFIKVFISFYLFIY